MADWTIVVDSTTEVCSSQPALQPPPLYKLEDERSSSQTSCRASSPSTVLPTEVPHRHPAWLVGSRSLESRPRSLSGMSFKKRRNTSRRPTIGAPSDFRKVHSGRISPLRRTHSFRPLQLSIYLPGNELPELPVFWKDDDIDEEEEEVLGLARPTQALVKSKSDPMLLRHPSSSFSIPRKPVASRSSSIDATSRFSMSSCFTFNTVNEASTHLGSRSTDRLRSGSIERRQSVATTQEFIDALDCHFPRPPAPAAIRSSSSTPEPGFTIYRKASEQSLRLRTHLEERQSLEKRLPDLLEEVSPVSPALDGKMPGLSPILDSDDFEAEDGPHSKDSSEEKHWFRASVHAVPMKHEARSSSSSSTLLNPPTPLLDALRADNETPVPVPSVITSISSNAQSSIRDRFSQWLLKALPNAPSPSPPPISQERRASTPMSLYSVTTTENARSAHTKQSSLSSSHWTRGSLDVEKTLAPPVPGVVGVAF